MGDTSLRRRAAVDAVERPRSLGVGVGAHLRGFPRREWARDLAVELERLSEHDVVDRQVDAVADHVGRHDHVERAGDAQRDLRVR